MTARRLSAFIDALALGRRPRPFPADPQDAAVLRTAIALRASRPGDAVPDDQFVTDLHDELAAQVAAPPANVQTLRVGRGRARLAAVAASVVLIAGTFVATEAFDQTPVRPAAVGAPHAQALRTGTFETADRQVMGQIVAYSGHPSWVYMNIEGSNYSGPIICKLQGNNGATVATGSFELHQGTGEWSKTITMDIKELRGAKLVPSAGAVVASASFA